MQTKAICYRNIEAQSANKELFELTVLIYEPFPDPKEGGDWGCAFRIQGFGEDLYKTAFGVDGLQALLHCIKSIDAHLQHIARSEGLTLSWLGLSDLGFHTDKLEP
jgi:hypothetical protein